MSDRASTPPAPVETQQAIEITDTESQAEGVREESPVKEEEVDEQETLPLSSQLDIVPKTEPTTEAFSSSPLAKSRKKKEEQRRAILLGDPQAEQVHPHEILCRYCRGWIRLQVHSVYALSNWEAHKARCSSASPVRRADSRVATAERKIALLNDPLVKECSPRRVLCGACRSVVALEGVVDYDLAKWTEHKEKCIPVIPAPITPRELTAHRSRRVPPHSASSTDTHVSADRPPRSPSPVGPSRNSVENTLVGDSPPTTVKVGVKREREEDEEEVAKDERPTNRPRTETRRTSSMFGWFVQPLQAFARGFREGLGPT